MYTNTKVTTFKERFSDLCAESYMTDSRIADGLKVSKQTISAWKTGTRSPKEPTIITISQFFHVSIAWLMGFDVPKYDGPDPKHESSLRERLQSLVNRIPEEKAALVIRVLESILEDDQK